MPENIPFIITVQNLDYEITKFIGAEIQLKNNLSEWIGKANSLKLKVVLQKYLEFVGLDIKKMQDYFNNGKALPLGITMQEMRSLIKETNERVLKCVDFEVKDSCLLTCIKAINQYKTNKYCEALLFAKKLDMQEYATIFHEMKVNEEEIGLQLIKLEDEINTSILIEL